MNTEDETQFDHDPGLSRRPEPDKELLARAHNVMLRQQTDPEKWVRQQWEVTVSAVRVALDAWRKIWPIEAAQMFAPHDYERVSEVESLLADAYHQLDMLEEPVLGGLMHLALLGELSREMLAAAEEEVGLGR